MANRFQIDAKFVSKPSYIGRVISKGINKGDKKPYIIVALFNDDGVSVLAKAALSNYRGKEEISFATINRDNQIIAIGNSDKKYIEVDEAGHRYVNNWLLPVDVEAKAAEVKAEKQDVCDELKEVQTIVSKNGEQPKKVEEPVAEETSAPATVNMPIYTEEEKEAEEDEEEEEEINSDSNAEALAIELGYDMDDEFSFDKHRYHQTRNKDARKKGAH